MVQQLPHGGLSHVGPSEGRKPHCKQLRGALNSLSSSKERLFCSESLGSGLCRFNDQGLWKEGHREIWSLFKAVKDWHLEDMSVKKRLGLRQSPTPKSQNASERPIHPSSSSLQSGAGDRNHGTCKQLGLLTHISRPLLLHGSEFVVINLSLDLKRT